MKRRTIVPELKSVDFNHPRPWETIEWLEIRSEPRNEQIAAVLRTIGTPFTVENGNIRITGWLRPADGRS